MLGHCLSNRYLIDARVGNGAMSEVYRALDLQTYSLVAIKVDGDLDRVFMPVGHRPLLREAHALSLISHPNITRGLDFGQTPCGRDFLVLEWNEGKPLSEWIRDKSIGPRKAMLLLMQACEALEAVHQAGFVHGDISPSNMMVSNWHSQNPSLKLIDFGLSEPLDPMASPASDDLLIHGTPTCMAPERITGKNAGQAADLYAVGVILYRCLTGRYPFRGPTTLATLQAHLHGQFAPLATSLGYQDWVCSAQALVELLLARQPENRAQNGSTARAYAKAVLISV